MPARSEFIDSLRSTIKDGRPPAVTDLRALADSGAASDFFRAGRIFASLEPGDQPFRPARIGILGTATIGPLEQILRGVLVASGILPTIDLGDYGAFDLALGAGDSPFAAREHDVVLCLLDDTYFLTKDWDASDVEALTDAVTSRVAALCELAVAAAERSSATILLHTVPLSAEVRDSVIGWHARTALSRCWSRLNTSLLELAEAHRRIEVADFAGVAAQAAVPVVDDRLRRFADLPYTDEALLLLATEVRRFLQAKMGLSRKVLALDLDNTLWGGVVGEVGTAGVQLGGLYPGNCYRDLQRTVLRLRQQGVILVLVSKNDESLVEAAFEEHPEMVLHLPMFSAVAVNWSDKAGNLRRAAADLDLATNSFVFMDDSAFERGQVARDLPEVALVPADGDPAYLIRSLLSRGFFDVMDVTSEDRRRPERYRTRAVRRRMVESFTSVAEYLESLGIEATITRASAFDIGRVAQLAARTNQFNLTGRRYDEAETAEMAGSPDHLVIACRVRDRLGDEGLVGAAWIDRGPDRWRVRNLVMSCRVLGRGVETAMVAWTARAARSSGVPIVEGRFARSPRNGVAAGLWTDSGFRLDGERDGEQVYVLKVDEAVDVPHWIRLREDSEGMADER